MSRVSLSLSRKEAQALLDFAPRWPSAEYGRVMDRVRAALTPKPRSSAVRKTESRKRSKAAETKEIRAAVMARADGRCECCGVEAGDFDRLEMDHYPGRIRIPQSVESCWALKRLCHRAKTENRPDAAYWLARFLGHCEAKGIKGPARKAAAARLDALRLSRGES